MDGHKQYLTDLIEGKLTRFIIPVYQRNYDWKHEQCARLFDDLVEVSKAERKEHFLVASFLKHHAVSVLLSMVNSV